MISGPALGMLIFGIVTLYIFGLGWGVIRVLRKRAEKRRELGVEK